MGKQSIVSTLTHKGQEMTAVVALSLIQLHAKKTFSKWFWQQFGSGLPGDDMPTNCFQGAMLSNDSLLTEPTFVFLAAVDNDCSAQFHQDHPVTMGTRCYLFSKTCSCTRHCIVQQQLLCQCSMALAHRACTAIEPAGAKNIEKWLQRRLLISTRICCEQSWDWHSHKTGCVKVVARSVLRLTFS